MFNIIIISHFIQQAVQESPSGVGLVPRVVVDFGADGIEYYFLGNADNILSDPPLYIWRVVCSQATLDAIEADPNYLVLSTELIEEVTP